MGKVHARQAKAAAEFEQKSRAIHGDYYDYSKVEYVKAKLPVIIICPKHGEFEQMPDKHLFGSGCPKCGLAAQKKKTMLGKEKFIQKAQAYHGDYYDYSEVDYQGAKKYVTIICPVHGPFEQYPDSHIRGKGCAKCGKIKKAMSRRSTKDSFVDKARKIHGDKYDYSLVKYETGRVDVTIICPEHGEFQQRPQNHLSGGGCPLCAVAKKSLNLPNLKKKILRAKNGRI